MVRFAAAALIAATATSCGAADPSLTMDRQTRTAPHHPTTTTTTTATTTTPTTAPPVAASRSRTATPAPAGSGDIWHRLAMCESGMRQDAVGAGVHYSYFQWRLATWRSVKAAGDPDDPRHAGYEQQKAAAQRLQARSGFGQWPACSRKIGARQ